MKLQTIHEARLAGSNRLPLMSQLYDTIKEVRPETTQDDVIKFIAHYEGMNMHSSFGLQDYAWIMYEGLTPLKDNPKAAEDILGTYIDEEYNVSIDD